MGTAAVNAVFVACAIPMSLILPKINTRLLLLILFLLGIALCWGSLTVAPIGHWCSSWPAARA
jgi:hypothetical protein